MAEGGGLRKNHVDPALGTTQRGGNTACVEGIPK
jgi:hypothetical protein